MEIGTDSLMVRKKGKHSVKKKERKMEKHSVRKKEKKMVMN